MIYMVYYYFNVEVPQITWSFLQKYDMVITTTYDSAMVLFFIYINLGIEYVPKQGENHKGSIMKNELN